MKHRKGWSTRTPLREEDTAGSDLERKEGCGAEKLEEDLLCRRDASELKMVGGGVLWERLV